MKCCIRCLKRFIFCLGLSGICFCPLSGRLRIGHSTHDKELSDEEFSLTVLMAFAVSKWFYSSILGWQSLARKAAYLLVCPPLLLAVSEFLSETAPARFPILRVSSPPPVTNIRMCQKANRRSKLTPSSRSHGRRKTDEEENLHLRFHRTQGNRQRLLLQLRFRSLEVNVGFCKHFFEPWQGAIKRQSRFNEHPGSLQAS